MDGKAQTGLEREVVRRQRPHQACSMAGIDALRTYWGQEARKFAAGHTSFGERLLRGL
jgi:hypothetical protein